MDGDDNFELELIGAGAQDLKKEEMGATIYTKPEDWQRVKQFLETKNIKTESAEIEYAAKEQIRLNPEDKERVQKFIEALESSEDISNYYTNAEI